MTAVCQGNYYMVKFGKEKRRRDLRTIKYYLKQSGLYVDQWEKMASDKSKWCKLIHESTESFENSCMQYSAYKRLCCKSERSPSPGPQSHNANCDISDKLCLSLACLKSHLRKYANLSCTQIMSLQKN